MKTLYRNDTEDMAASFNGAAIHCENIEGFSVSTSFTDTTPVDGDTFVSGVLEIQTLTFPSKAGTTHRDYIVCYDQAGVSYAVSLQKPVAEIQTLTFPTKAGAANGDYIVVQDTVGTKYAVALTKPVAEVQTLTFPALLGATDGDYVILQDTTGGKWAVAMDTTGLAAATPTGAAWAAISAGRKVYYDFSGGTTAASMAAKAELAFNSLTGFSAVITSDDSASDGTMLMTSIIKAPVTDPAPHNADDTGVGSILGVQTTGGVAAQTPTGAAWVAATYKGLADISADTTAAQVAARAETALNLLTGFTAAITSDDSAANGTMLLTQALKAPVVDPVPHTYNESGAGSISGVQSTGGVAIASPTGVAWTAATYKGNADISSDTTAANVAARAETAFNALMGFTAAITSNDGAADGTMLFTQIIRGPVTNPVPKTFNDSGAGSIAGVQTTGGVTSDVNLTSNVITIASAATTPLYTGLKIRLTTSSSLPTGLSTGVDYYVIYVSDTTYKLATTAQNALDGVAIDITDYGVGTQTLDIRVALTGALTLQASNNAFLDNVNNEEDPDAIWTEITGSSVSVTTTGTHIWNVADCYYKAARVVWTATAGIGDYVSYTFAKGPY